MTDQSTARLRSAVAIIAMGIAVMLVYWPPPQETPANGRIALRGSDFEQLHMLRLDYARDALFGAQRSLPGWYTRELGGTPFWANMQNFPCIPTRLPLLLVEPDQAYAIGVQIAALLSALFTYFYLRNIRIGCVGAAVGGWTFACSGFFASRVMAGHLPLLEAYPALPLLLWLIERCVGAPVAMAQAAGPPLAPSRRLFALALASMCIALAGHPQIPIYSFTIAALYIIYRCRIRRSFGLLGAMLAGIGLASFALVPMLMLIARSTRVLTLDPPGNDIAFPYARLAAFIFPWIDGWTPNVRRAGIAPFSGYPNITYFWDTVCYVGLLPLMGGAFLTARAIALHRRPAAPWMFLAVAGGLALMLALPWWHETVMSHLPGTILRSPARQLYVTTFVLACAAAGAVHIALKLARTSGLRAVLFMAIGAHACDLGWAHDRCFVSSFVFVPTEGSDRTHYQSLVGQQRISVDYALGVSFNRQIDDVGIFDSILLARPYRAVQDTAGIPPRFNTQVLGGGSLPPRTLRFFGVKIVVTPYNRPDLTRLGITDNFFCYEVANPIPRASVVPLERAQFLSSDQIHQRLREPDFDLAENLLLPTGSARPAGAAQPELQPGVEYRRDSTDQFSATITSPSPGYLRLLETWDPGWRATVDGAAAPILCAYDCFMAIPVSPGTHQVQLTYYTAGATLGLWTSAICLIFLCGLCVWQGFGKQGKV